MRKMILMLCGLMTFSVFALEVGDKAPAIEAKDQDGKIWKQAEKQGGKYLVVYFYPAAMTGGCTKQACAYRDHLKKEKPNFTVVGISGDPVPNLKWFQTSQKLNFPLLSDPDGAIAKAFGVPVKTGDKSIKRTVDGKEVELKRSATTSRWTFIVSPEGKVVYKADKVKAVQDLQNVLNFLAKEK